jgi:hypothetical protein
MAIMAIMATDVANATADASPNSNECWHCNNNRYKQGL